MMEDADKESKELGREKTKNAVLGTKVRNNFHNGRTGQKNEDTTENKLWEGAA